MKSVSQTAFPSGDVRAIIHSLTPNDQAVMAGLRSMALPNKGKLRGIEARAPFDAIIGRTPAPEGVVYRQDTIGGVAGWWCEPADAAAGKVVLHLHGGWFNWGSAEAYRHLVGHIARGAQARAFVPDYRLAPEHPFPAALDDALACFDGLLERGAAAIAVTGDSAGGNLALALLSQIAARLPDSGKSPVGAAVFSPVTDLTLSGNSWESRADADPYFVKDQAESLIRSYLNGHNPADPLVSPLYGDLSGLPPVRVLAGDDEVLLDDAWRYVERALAAGVDATLNVWEGMPHGFLNGLDHFEASSEALREVGAFLNARLSLPA